MRKLSCGVMPMFANSFIGVPLLPAPPQDSCRQYEADPRPKNGDQLFPAYSALDDILLFQSPLEEIMASAPHRLPPTGMIMHQRAGAPGAATVRKTELFLLTVNEVKDDTKWMN